MALFVRKERFQMIVAGLRSGSSGKTFKNWFSRLKSLQQNLFLDYFLLYWFQACADLTRHPRLIKRLMRRSHVERDKFFLAKHKSGPRARETGNGPLVVGQLLVYELNFSLTLLQASQAHWLVLLVCEWVVVGGWGKPFEW